MPNGELPQLIGREAEWSAVARLLDGLSERGGPLLLRGDPGIGKSSLLAHARAVAAERGLLVLSATGFRSETSFPFAALERLTEPLRASFDDLPTGQRNALQSAFGGGGASAPEVFIVALAFLTLLSDAARTRQILIVVDDLQWIDPSTDDVLQFVARRLEHEPVALLAAVRDGVSTRLGRGGIPVQEIAPLGDEAASRLLDDRAPGLPPAVRSRLLAESAGNPLALVELPAAASAGGVADGALPLTTRLNRAFAERVRELPPTTRKILIVAAINGAGTFAETVGAARVMLGTELSDDALDPALEHRIVTLGVQHLEFRHPLIRSAVDRSASPAERRAAHAALAQVVEDDDRRAVHRGYAARGPDEAVAQGLEDLAQRTRWRGADGSAIGALERAADLSEDPVEAGRRLLEAAGIAATMGRGDELRRLLSKTDPIALSEHQRVRVAFLRQHAAVTTTDGLGGEAGTCAMAECVESAVATGDLRLAGHLLIGAGSRAWFWNQSAATCAMLVAAADSVVAATSRDNPHALRCYADADLIGRGAFVLESLDRIGTRELDPESHYLLGIASSVVGAFAQTLHHTGLAIDGLRAHGRLGLLTETCVTRAFAAFQMGDFRVAVTTAAEGESVAEDVCAPWTALTIKLPIGLIAAVRGDEDAALAAANAIEQVCLPQAGSAYIAHVLRIRALLAIGVGRHTDALQYLLRLYDPHDVAGHTSVAGLAVGDLVEAAVHSGDRSAVPPILASMEARARVLPSPALLAGLRYARALLAGEEDAEPLFRAALSSEPASCFDAARTKLAYGQWLRRGRRVADSRAPLRESLATFESLGAGPWSARARRELVASGATSRRETADGIDDLTPQELQIASLAAEGMTNRDIGRLLYVSHRTVGSHLYRIFPKLGITSRAELPGALKRDPAHA